jgi:hypothetical protein
MHRATSHFNLDTEATDAQARKLAELALDIEAGRLPTQIFVKVR